MAAVHSTPLEPTSSSSGRSNPAEAIQEARTAVYGSIDGINTELRQLNQSIHDNPELGYEEVLAHETLTKFLENQGFSVTQHAYGLKTSFEAEIGSGGRLVVFCAEYDALPGIGHACGHNLIATSSTAAFIGLAKTVQKLGIPGRVRILGTPAEEGGGGKVKLIEAGAFKDEISAAIMCHPFPSATYKDGYTGLAGSRLIASYKMRIEFRGKSSHAAGAPWNGVNALDAAIAAYNNVSMLRQQIQPDERIHGVIEDGGNVPNVIPDYTRMNWYIRSPTMNRATELAERVKSCFEAAVMSTGCKLSYIHAPTYMDLRANQTLCTAYVEDMADLGEKIHLNDDKPITASTDMGNVSYTVPSFHGSFGIPAPDGTTLHHPAFAAAAGTDEAHSMAIRVSKGLAMMGWRVLTDEKVAQGARADFEKI